MKGRKKNNLGEIGDLRNFWQLEICRYSRVFLPNLNCNNCRSDKESLFETLRLLVHSNAKQKKRKFRRSKSGGGVTLSMLYDSIVLLLKGFPKASIKVVIEHTINNYRINLIVFFAFMFKSTFILCCCHVFLCVFFCVEWNKYIKKSSWKKKKKKKKIP